MGELKYFLGIEVLRSNAGILLNQRKYVLELISEMGLSGAKPAATPLEANIKLTSVEYDQANAVVGDNLLKEITAYQRLVGKLLYVTITRHGINYDVHALSQFMQMAKKSHWEAVIRLVRYLKVALGQGVLMSSGYTKSLTYWCDSDWVACPNTRRSVTGYVIKFGDSLVSWKTKKIVNRVKELSRSRVYKYGCVYC